MEQPRISAKQFFRQVRIAENELKVLNAKLRHYEDIGFSMGGGTGMVGSRQRGTSRVELAAIGAVDVFRDLHEQQKQYTAIIARAEQVIRGIRQDKYRQILNYRYLCGWSFKSISDELGYNDPNSVYRAHGYALHEAQMILSKQRSAEDDIRSIDKTTE